MPEESRKDLRDLAHSLKPHAIHKGLRGEVPKQLSKFYGQRQENGELFVYTFGLHYYDYVQTESMRPILVKVIDCIERKFGVRPNACLTKKYPKGYRIPQHQEQKWTDRGKNKGKFEEDESVFIVRVGAPWYLRLAALADQGKTDEADMTVIDKVLLE